MTGNACWCGLWHWENTMKGTGAGSCVLTETLLCLLCTLYLLMSPLSSPAELTYCLVEVMFVKLGKARLTDSIACLIHIDW